MQTRCSGCGLPYEAREEMLAELAGKKILCPACGGVISVPPGGTAEEVVRLRHAEPVELRPAFGAAPGQVGVPPLPNIPPSWPDPRAVVHVRLIGIFNIVAGGLNVLYGILMAGYGLFLGGMFTLAGASGPRASAAGFEKYIGLIIGGVLLLMGLAAVGGGAVQIIGGILPLRRRPNASRWAMAGAIVSCASIWTLSLSCLYPLLLAAGIYALIALAKPEVKLLMNQPPWTD